MNPDFPAVASTRRSCLTTARGAWSCLPVRLCRIALASPLSRATTPAARTRSGSSIQRHPPSRIEPRPRTFPARGAATPRCTTQPRAKCTCTADTIPWGWDVRWTTSGSGTARPGPELSRTKARPASTALAWPTIRRASHSFCTEARLPAPGPLKATPGNGTARLSSGPSSAPRTTQDPPLPLAWSPTPPATGFCFLARPTMSGSGMAAP